MEAVREASPPETVLFVHVMYILGHAFHLKEKGGDGNKKMSCRKGGRWQEKLIHHGLLNT